VILSKAVRFFLVFVVALFAQAALASSNIVGFVTVKGPNAPVGPIANAFVMVSDPAFPKQVLYAGQTNSQGFFNISGVAPGTYRVDFSTPGFLKGILSSFSLADNQTVQLTAQLVPSLTGTEVHKNNVKDETSYTIHNPNNFIVQFTWTLPNHHATGTGVAYPGDTIIETNQWPHSENISLFVDDSKVQKETTTVVAPPVVIGNLTGSVRSGSLPLGGVQVVLTDSSNNQLGTVFTLSDGSYVFTNQPAGTYTLGYSLAGFISASQNYNLPVGGGQAPTVFLAQIPAPPTANVDVTVTTDSGGPAAFASVAIAYSNGATATRTADGNGLASFTIQPVNVAATITATAIDGTNRTASATTSGFVAGANAVTIILPPIPKGSIAGVVTDGGTGLPIAGASVAVLDANDAVDYSTTTASDGSYTVSGVTPGMYTVTFFATNYTSQSKGGTNVNSGATTTVSVALDSNLASVNVTVIDALSGLGVPNSDVTIRYTNGTSSATLTTDGHGTVNFTGQPSGVAASVGAFVRDGSNRSNATDVPAGFASGSNSVIVTVPTSLCTMFGRVFDKVSGVPIIGASVSVTNGITQQVYSATTDSAGKYTISGFPDGKYTITATANGYTSYLEAGIPFDIGANRQQDIALQTLGSPTGATVVVTVIDAQTGSPALNASVTIAYNDRTTAGPLFTGPSGQVEFDNQETGVGATITARLTDGRTGAASSIPGFGNGLNTFTVTVPAPNNGNGSIQGSVVDTTTGLPISGARVTVTDSRGAIAGSATTDGHGNYSVSLAGGTYTLAFSASGYQDFTLPNVSVFPGQTTTAHTVAMVPIAVSLATVNVTVIDGQTGLPVQGVSVTINYSAPVAVPTLLTDANGLASFTNQPTGIGATIVANASDGRQATQSFPQFSPGTTSATLTLPVTSASNLTGHVYSASTQLPLANVAIQANDANTGKFVSGTTTAPDGSYVLTGLFPGTYNVSYRLNGYQALTVVLKPGGNYDAFLQPLAVTLADVVVAVKDRNFVPITPSAVTITYSDGSPSVNGTTDPTGVVRFTSQPVGVPATISASSSGPLGNFTGSTTATFGGGPNSVTVIVTSNLGTIDGTVVDASTSQFLANASVTVRDATGHIAQSTASGTQGTYHISNLPPGTYAVTFGLNGYVPLTLTVPVQSGQTTQANASMTPIDPNAALVTIIVEDALRRSLPNTAVTITFDGGGVVSALSDQSGVAHFYNQPVGVSATMSATSGQTATISVPDGFRAGGNEYEMRIPGSSGIQGFVRDANDSKLLSGVSVTLSLKGNPTSLAQTTTDAGGIYSFAGLAGADYTLTFSKSGYQTATNDITLADGNTAVQNASLTPIAAPPTANALIYVFDIFSQSFMDQASVSLAFIDGRTYGPQLTDSNGLVYFQDMPSGLAYTVNVLGPVDLEQFAQGPLQGGNNTIEIVYGGGATPPPVSNVTIRALDPQNQPVANATVTITYSNGHPSQTGTTDASGNVTFGTQPAGVPATINIVSAFGNGTSNQSFPEGNYSTDVHIQATHSRVTVIVIGGDGTGPAANAFVTIGSLSVITDANGQAVFDSVPVGSTRIDAVTSDFRVGGDQFNIIGVADTIFILVF